MSYSNAIFYIDPEAGNDSARAALTGVTVANPSGTITRCTKTAHGLVTGAVVDLTLFSSWLNSAWKITVVDADNFDLDGAVWQATADNNGTATPRGGASKADAWLTMANGATAARVAAGDTVRLKASPDPTLVGDCSWTQYSKTVTLPGAVTATICDCETAWTGAANVTQTADTTLFKEGTKSAKSVIGSAFTTGKIAHFATGTLDLSSYQQVSFWFRNNGFTLINPGLTLRLCSDTTGDVAVNTIALPAIPSTGYWVPITVDTGAALGASIKSVALYAEIDPITSTYNIDNIIACKAASSADSLTLTSLIGKVHNLSWVASSTYAANTIRRPTQPNRNGFCYQVTAGGGGAAGASEPAWPLEIGATVVDGALTWTCIDLEDTWYPIQSISGTTVKLDSHVNTLGSAGRGYDGATETVATYKRETSKQAMQSGNGTNLIATSGTQFNPVTFTGGWDRTTMAQQAGETWLDSLNGNAHGISGFSVGPDYVNADNINGVRGSYGIYAYGTDGWRLRNIHQVGFSSGLYLALDANQWQMTGVVLACCGSYGWWGGADISGSFKQLRISNGLDAAMIPASANQYERARFQNVVFKNNAGYGLMAQTKSPLEMVNLTTANNGSGAIMTNTVSLRLTNAVLAEAAKFSGLAALKDQYIYSHNHDRIAGNHLITTDGGTISSATDQRHTLSGISWKFSPTSTNRGPLYPLRLPIAKIVCAAGVPVSLAIWCRRDSTNIKGQLLVAGGQLAGVPVDISVACEPAVNGWAQSGTLTFTPLETGVIEVQFRVYDGIGISANFWIDDFSVA